ncbi:Myomesin-2 [Saguinus oedipus]|uniref:Myomesin-2 n=1 Tax=Saguinus oedipus TaxID=9490 RepID=A0ABQ9UAF2_SAGOE|nr:Myomesin-2 [Saguinus oedipus]
MARRILSSPFLSSPWLEHLQIRRAPVMTLPRVVKNVKNNPCLAPAGTPCRQVRILSPHLVIKGNVSHSTFSGPFATCRGKDSKTFPKHLTGMIPAQPALPRTRNAVQQDSGEKTQSCFVLLPCSVSGLPQRPEGELGFEKGSEMSRENPERILRGWGRLVLRCNTDCECALCTDSQDSLKNSISGDVQIPGPPTNVQASEISRNYVVLSWEPPSPRGRDPLMYFIEKAPTGKVFRIPHGLCLRTSRVATGWQSCIGNSHKTDRGRKRSLCRESVCGQTLSTSPPAVSIDAVTGVLYFFGWERLRAMTPWGSHHGCLRQMEDSDFSHLPNGEKTPANTNLISRSLGRCVKFSADLSVVGSGSWQRVNAQTAVRSPRYAVFDLMEGKSYVFRVLSANRHGLSEPSEITSPIQAQDITAPASFHETVVPSAPGRVLASRNTKTSVVVQWDRPKHEEDLLGYYVDCCVAGTNAWEPCNHKPIGYNRFVVHGLTTGEQYIFRVKAVNAVGMSENSQESDVIKVQAALTVPSHPYGITLLNCDGHSMTLGWKVPKFSGGSPILGYYMDKREVRHQNWHEVNSSPSKPTILTDMVPVPVITSLVPSSEALRVDGLTEGSLYEFKIAAVNLAGIGEPSDPSEHFKCEAWTMPEPGKWLPPGHQPSSTQAG